MSYFLQLVVRPPVRNFLNREAWYIPWWQVVLCRPAFRRYMHVAHRPVEPKPEALRRVEGRS